jgi:uncharacterized membrane protein
VFVFIGLLGFIGLTINGGRFFSERRQSQSASDNAALTAARALCVGQDLVSSALTIAAANGFDNNGSTNTLTIHRPSTSSVFVGDAHAFEVITDSNLPGSLISLVYPRPIQVTSPAVSQCTPSSYGPAGGGNAIIENGFSASGNGNVTANNVMLYRKNGAFNLTGNGGHGNLQKRTDI